MCLYKIQAATKDHTTSRLSLGKKGHAPAAVTSWLIKITIKTSREDGGQWLQRPSPEANTHDWLTRDTSDFLQHALGKEAKRFESRLPSIYWPSKLHVWGGDTSLTRRCHLSRVPVREEPAWLPVDGNVCICIFRRRKVSESPQFPVCESLVGVCFLGSGFESPPFLLLVFSIQGEPSERNRKICDGKSGHPKVGRWQLCQQWMLKIILLSVNKYITFINNDGKEEGGGRKRNKSIKDVIEVSGSRV